MAAPADAAHIAILEDSIRVSGPAALTNRRARMFFRGLLGAEWKDGAWTCPLRRHTAKSLALTVHDYLRQEGVSSTGDALYQEVVSRELERQRSFARTRERALAVKRGESEFDFGQVAEALRDLGWSSSRGLRDHQRRGVALGLTSMNIANFSVPGSGKTITALATAAVHFHARTIDALVVVGPLACFQPWEDETRAALGGKLRPLRVRGSARQRIEIYDRATKGDLLLLSYATAAADLPVLTELFGRLRVMLVADESHRVKRFRGGLWSAAMMELAAHARVRMLLTGTPMPQSGKDLFSQLRVLWPEGQLTGAQDDFARRAEKDLDGVLDDISPFTTRTAKSELGLRPYEVVRHLAPMTGTQAEVYRLVEGGLRRSVEGALVWQDKIDALRRARPIRLLQAATNPQLLNVNDRYYDVPRVSNRSPSSLLERLASYGEDPADVPRKHLVASEILREVVSRGEKTVCWSNFLLNLDQFATHVRTSLGIPVFQVDGRVPTATDGLRGESSEMAGTEDVREAVIQRFLRTRGPAVLITNPASCSESISLHSTCHNAIYLDRTYDCAMFLQSIDRIHRLGLPDYARVTIHLLEATLDGAASIDGLVSAALSRKEGRMRRILEGAELSAIELNEDPTIDAEGDAQDLEELLRYLLGEDRR